MVGACALARTAFPRRHAANWGAPKFCPKAARMVPQKRHNPLKGFPNNFWKPAWCLLGFLDAPEALDQVCKFILWGCLLRVGGTGGAL